jgi:photosystem II stability/assembly factor-like uncharacterized protein
MKKLLSAFCTAIILLLFTTLPANAQWETNGPYGEYVTSLTMKGSNIYAGTFANGVFKSSDDGKTWMAANKGLQAVWVRDMANNSAGIFAGTFFYGVFFSADNGNTWTARNNGLFSLEVNKLFEHGSDLFASTNAGIYFSPDNGLNWMKRYNGMSATTNIRSWISMGDTIYGGTNGQGVFRTNDKGQNWVKVTSGFPTSGAFYIFSFASQGNTIYASTTDGIYISTDRGLNWNKQGTAFSSPLYAAQLVVHDGLLFASAGNDGVYVSSDDGMTFTKVSSGLPNFPSGDGYSVTEDFLSTGTSLIAAMQSGIYRTTDNGANWSEASEAVMNVRMQDIVNNGEVIVSTSDYAGVFVSADKGKTWTHGNTGLPTYRTRALAASGTDLYASVLFGKVYRSDDNAATWEWASNGLPSSVIFMEADNTRVFAAVEGQTFMYDQLFQTKDKGMSWTEIPTAGFSGAITAIGVRNEKVYVGGQGTLMRTSDDGATWTDLGSYLPMANVSAILALDGVTYVGTEGKGIFMFTNNDSEMKGINNGLTNYHITDIVQQNGLLFASTMGGGVFVSVTGHHWFAFNGGLNNLFIRKMAGADLQLFAATRIGVYQTINASFDEMRVLASVNSPDDENTVSFFPNPSTGVIFFASEENGISIDIYDITGKLVSSDSGNGFSAGSIDLSSQPRGVYIMKIKGEKSIITKRVVLR